MTVIKMPRVSKTETEIAVLQVQMKNVEEKVEDVRSDIRDIREASERSSAKIESLLNEMRDSAEKAHNALDKKIGSLEKWRYMMMGAGIAIGYFGFEFIAKLLQAH